MTREQRIAELEKASEGLGRLAAQRDQLQAELRTQVAEVADLRGRVEAQQELAKAREQERAELAQLALVAKESISQLTTRLGG